ncbi:hypothetical protein DFH08DRAFT_821966 [Mycena albidolilacea]|uniref:Uncharacterized protein n=1 Tax=Mycena albidolilacea TaxID=1033008 RepID=A0AAD6Z9A3_9AGAR|nr:hypothetical protein DFH08DRAFT_821966 [Mycena albidolilacea]
MSPESSRLAQGRYWPCALAFPELAAAASPHGRAGQVQTHTRIMQASWWLHAPALPESGTTTSLSWGNGERPGRGGGGPRHERMGEGTSCAAYLRRARWLLLCTLVLRGTPPSPPRQGDCDCERRAWGLRGHGVQPTCVVQGSCWLRTPALPKSGAIPPRGEGERGGVDAGCSTGAWGEGTSSAAYPCRARWLLPCAPVLRGSGDATAGQLQTRRARPSSLAVLTRTAACVEQRRARHAFGAKKDGAGNPALPTLLPPSSAPPLPPPCSNVGVGRHEGAQRDVGEGPLGSMRGAAACLPAAWAQIYPSVAKEYEKALESRRLKEMHRKPAFLSWVTPRVGIAREQGIQREITVGGGGGRRARDVA